MDRYPRVRSEQGCGSPDHDECKFVKNVKFGYRVEECSNSGCSRWRSHLIPEPPGGGVDVEPNGRRGGKQGRPRD